MNAIPFDTLKMARKLEAAGFPGPQAAGAAEAMAEAMSGAELATKADLQAVKADLLAVKTDPGPVITPAQMRTLCEVANRRIDFVAMEIRLMFALADIRRGFERFRRDITIRFSAMVIAQAAIVMAAMHVMLAHR